MYIHYILFLDFLIYSIIILIINYMYYLFLGMDLPDRTPELNRNFHTYRMCHIDMTHFQTSSLCLQEGSGLVFYC